MDDWKKDYQVCTRILGLNSEISEFKWATIDVSC